MPQPYVVASPEQLEAIASPGREEIMDVVGLIAPCGISDLARALGRSRNSLYYHVKALRDCGLLVETRRSGEGKRTTAHYDVPGRPLSVHFDLSTPARKAAVVSLARARVRSAIRGFERACEPGVATVEGPRRNLWATHMKGWLTDDELAEANVLIGRLVELVGKAGAASAPGQKAYEYSFVLAPITPRRSPPKRPR